MMGGLASALGNSKIALAIALIIQAIIFGLVHFYKGPLGMTNSMVSGLFFGLLIITARGAIWPAFLAHGLNNSICIWNIYTAG